MKDEFSFHESSAKRTRVHLKIQLKRSLVTGQFFNEFVTIYAQGNKALITIVGLSVQEYITISLFCIDNGGQSMVFKDLVCRLSGIPILGMTLSVFETCGMVPIDRGSRGRLGVAEPVQDLK